MRLSSTSKIGLLLVSSLPLAWASNRVAGPERRLAWSGAPADASARPPRGVVADGAKKTVSPDKPWTEISGEEAARLFESHAIFFDARRTSAFREGHIAGARSLPVWEDIDARLKALVAENLDPSAPVVVYCSGGDCEDSHQLGQKLYLTGFDAVRVYTGGFPDWEARRLPVRRGPTP